MRVRLIGVFLVIGCSNPDPQQAELAETETTIADESDGAEAEDSESGTPYCNDEDCNSSCALEFDDCDRALIGACAGPVCECQESEPCIDCRSDADCGQWEWCDPDLGCNPCFSETIVAWDPDLACSLDLSAVEPIMLPFVRVEIAGVRVPLTASCDELPAGVVLDTQLQICPEACAAFEQAGGLSVILYCPGE